VTTAPTTTIRRLAVARAIAVTGYEAGWIALMVAVYAETHSTVWMSAALFAVIASAGLAAPVAGALGDRYDRRRVMIWSELAAAVFAAAMVVTSDPAPLIGLAALVGLAEAPFMPASTAAVPNLVADERLQWANSTLAVGRNAGQLLGPLCGGVLAAAIGSRAVFAAMTLAFVVAAALVASVGGRFSEERQPHDHDRQRELRAGFVFTWNSRVLRGITAAWAVLLFMLGPILVAELPLAHAFGQGAAGYGLIASCWGAGGLAGSFLGRVTARRFESGTMIWGCVMMGAGFATVAGAPLFAFALAGMLLAGLSDGAVTVAEQTIVQRHTPDAVRSRVNAAGEAVAMMAFALSFPSAGFIIQLLGVRGAYAMAALGCVLAGAILVPTMREARAARAGPARPSEARRAA
jgi:MFS family permease